MTVLHFVIPEAILQHAFPINDCSHDCVTPQMCKVIVAASSMGWMPLGSTQSRLYPMLAQERQRINHRLGSYTRRPNVRNLGPQTSMDLLQHPHLSAHTLPLISLTLNIICGCYRVVLTQPM